MEFLAAAGVVVVKANFAFMAHTKEKGEADSIIK